MNGTTAMAATKPTKNKTGNLLAAIVCTKNENINENQKWLDVREIEKHTTVMTMYRGPDLLKGFIFSAKVILDRF